MITPEQHAEIRRLYFGERWKVGAEIATNLGVHHDTVRTAESRWTAAPCRAARATSTKLDPYLPFIRETLEQYPRLRQRGSTPCCSRAATTGPRCKSGGSSACCGRRSRGRCTAAWSSCQRKSHRWTGAASGQSTLVYDRLKSAVLERHGTAIRFHPRLLELAGHYHFAVRPCTPARGNEKGKVERQILYLRDAFFAARTFRDVDDLNAQFRRWRDEVAHQRPVPNSAIGPSPRSSPTSSRACCPCRPIPSRRS